MSTAKELAKEISTAVLAKVALNYKTATIQQMNDMVASVIAAKLEPLVGNAERYRKLMEINDRFSRIKDDQPRSSTIIAKEVSRPTRPEVAKHIHGGQP